MKSRHASIFLIPIFFVFLGCQSVKEKTSSEESVLRVLFPETIQSYSPFNFENKNRMQLANIYESLIVWDKDFNSKSSLAISWGRLDDKTWEFNLRKGVLFHDQTGFDAEDLRFSFEKAKETQALEGVDSMEIVDAYKVRFYTKKADPYFLHRIASLWVTSSETFDKNTAVGTGPYYIRELGPYQLDLQAFPSYWGASPNYDRLVLKQIVDPEERVMAFLQGEADVMVQIPPQAYSRFESENWHIYDFPSLESHFLMLNKSLLEKEAWVDLLWYTLQDDYTQVLGAHQLQPLTQLAAMGLTGWDSEKSWLRKDARLAESARLSMEGLTTLQIDLPEGLELLGNLLEKDIRSMDLDLSVKYWPLGDYEKHILSGQSEAYFFGWKFDHGDLADFFVSVLAPGAPYNGLNFDYDGFTQDLEVLEQEVDQMVRMKLLQEMTARILQTKRVIPLFETMHSLVLRDGLVWRARLDGMIYAQDFLIKN